jgi:hypothetical protein
MKSLCLVYVIFVCFLSIILYLHILTFPFVSLLATTTTKKNHRNGLVQTRPRGFITKREWEVPLQDLP